LKGRKVLQAPYVATDMPERHEGHQMGENAAPMINLVPASPAVPAAAAKQNHNDDDDQKRFHNASSGKVLGKSTPLRR
jgi:hypothetical protein